jgi:hypothetical protein
VGPTQFLFNGYRREVGGGVKLIELPRLQVRGNHTCVSTEMAWERQNTFFFCASTALSESRLPRRWGLVIILRHTTLDRILLDEWSDRRRDFYMTTHNIHKGWISMPQASFELTNPESERPQTHALDRAATVISPIIHVIKNRIQLQKIT